MNTHPLLQGLHNITGYKVKTSKETMYPPRWAQCILCSFLAGGQREVVICPEASAEPVPREAIRTSSGAHFSSHWNEWSDLVWVDFSTPSKTESLKKFSLTKIPKGCSFPFAVQWQLIVKARLIKVVTKKMFLSLAEIGDGWERNRKKTQIWETQTQFQNGAILNTHSLS